MVNILYSKIGNKLILLIFSIIFFSHYYDGSKIFGDEYDKIYTQKGFYEMENSLKPLIVQSKKRFYGLYEINKPNSVTTLNKNGDYSILTIDKSEQVEMKTIKNGFPRG